MLRTKSRLAQGDPLVPSQQDLERYDRHHHLPSFCAPVAHDLLITNCPEPRTQDTEADLSLGEVNNAA